MMMIWLCFFFFSFFVCFVLFFSLFYSPPLFILSFTHRLQSQEEVRSHPLPSPVASECPQARQRPWSRQVCFVLVCFVLACFVLAFFDSSHHSHNQSSSTQTHTHTHTHTHTQSCPRIFGNLLPLRPRSLHKNNGACCC